MRASSSHWASLNGLSRKYRNDTTRLINVAIKRFLIDFFNSGKSNVPKAKPAPKIGPINGEINMAPMITAVELTFSPTEAMTIAQANIQALAPLKEILLMTFYSTFSFSSSSLCRSKKLNSLFMTVSKN